MTQPLFAPPACDVVRVALPVPTGGLFEYSVPAPLASRARPGCRVRVRVRERTLTGVIVERGGSPGLEGRRRAIEKLLDPEPVLSEAMLSILRDAAAEVLCPIGIALATALPAGSAPRVSRGFALTARGSAALAGGGPPPTPPTGSTRSVSPPS